MIINEVIKRLKETEKKYGDCLHVSANRINNISCLIIKNSAGKVIECIVLDDGNFGKVYHRCKKAVNDE